MAFIKIDHIVFYLQILFCYFFCLLWTKILPFPCMVVKFRSMLGICVNMTPTFCLLLHSKWQNFTDLYRFVLMGLAKTASFSQRFYFQEVNQSINLYIWIFSLLWECSLKCDMGHIALLFITDNLKINESLPYRVQSL